MTRGYLCPGGICQGDPTLYGNKRAVRILLECILVEKKGTHENKTIQMQDSTVTYTETITLGPAYNEFGYNEHLAITNRFLCMNVIYCNVKKFSYTEHPLIMSGFFCIFTRCKQDPMYLG